MPLVDQHPLGAELEAFALGRLDDDLFAAVEEHVAACSACEAVVSRISGDTFTALLQAAQSRSDTPKPLVTEATAVEPRSGVDDGTGPWTAATEEVRTDLPAVLASSPRYRPLRRLGSGGMGAVWLAEHRVMGRQVAVKVIRPEFVAKAGAAERFHRETQAAARLHHPNIVTAFDAEQAGDTPLLAMEYIDGVCLADELRRRGPLPITEACDAVRQAALGLQHAFDCGLIHRDLKPHNLMRTADGTVKVLDFGLAVLCDARRGEAGLTGENVVLGTPDYIAPEQGEDSHAADIRSDVYSLGCTLYHLLTGRVPFPGASVLRKLDAHRKQEPEPLRTIRPEVPAELAAVVARMMAKSPADRYQTPAEVAAALAPFAAGTTPVRKRSRTWVAIAAALLAGIVVAAGFYRIQTDNGEVVITPGSPDVEIVLLQGGKEVEVIDTKTRKRVRVPTGTYDLTVKNKPDGIEVKHTDKIVVSRGEAVLVTIERVAKAPDPKTSEKVGEVRRFEGHEGPVRSVAISPDGRYALSGSGFPQGDRTVRLWDVTLGKEVRRFEGHEGAVEFVAFSPDGKRALSSSFDKTVRLWDVETGRELRVFRGHGGITTGVAFTPDGKQALSASEDRTVRLWDLETGKELRQFKGHTHYVLAVSLAPDGRRFLSASWDGTVRLWNLETGAELRRYRNSTSALFAVVYLPDGRRFLTGGDDGILGLWDLETGKELHRFKGHTLQVYGLAVSREGRRALSASHDGTVRLWDVETGQQLQCFRGHREIVYNVAISPDGRYGLSGGGGAFRDGQWVPGTDWALRLWRLPDPQNR